jgi:hypothetical protein
VDRGTAVSSAAAGTAKAVEEFRRLGRHSRDGSVNGEAISGRHRPSVIERLLNPVSLHRVGPTPNELM